MNILKPPVVPSDDRGFLLGDGLFETLRLYRGRPFRLAQHLDRLRRGARTVGLSVPESLEARVDAELRGWGPRDGVLRITLTRGSGFGLAPPPVPKSLCALTLRPLLGGRPADPPRTAVIRGRVDEHALVSGLKALGFLERVQALRLAREAGVDEALLRNSRGQLVEGSASNLFAVVDGTLIAPGPTDGALPGITRAVILELADASGLPVTERGLSVEELPDTTELFLSSSVMELAAITEVEGRAIGAAEVGPLCRSLTTRYGDLVDRELDLV